MTTHHFTKGRCHRCLKAFTWPAKTGLLRDAWCPFCGGKLRPTTHLLKSVPILTLTTMPSKAQP